MNIKTKTVLTSFFIIGSVLSIVANGTWAYYSNSQSNGENEKTIVDILINRQNPWNEIFTFSPAMPGYTGFINLTIENIGNKPADLYLKIFNVIDSDVLRSEPEDKAEQSGDVHDISTKIKVSVDGNDKGTLSGIAGQLINIGNIDVGKTVKLNINFYLDQNAGNEYQGDQSRFDIEISAIQSTKNEPGGSGGGRGDYLSGSSSGNDCQGVVTKEPISNVALSETVTKDTFSDIPINYNYILYGNNIYQIVVVNKNDEKCVSIRTEILKNISRLVTEPAPGTVYSNVNIWAGTKKIDNILVKFRVNSSWMAENSIAASDIKLLRWDGSKWIVLETKVVDTDGTYTYFEVRTTGLSSFAISSTKGITVPKETPSMTVPIEIPTSVKETAAEPVETTKAPGFETILTVVGLSAIYIFGKLGRKRT